MKMMRLIYRILTWLLVISIVSTATLAFTNQLSWWWVAALFGVLLIDLLSYGRYIEAEKDVDIFK